MWNPSIIFVYAPPKLIRRIVDSYWMANIPIWVLIWPWPTYSVCGTFVGTTWPLTLQWRKRNFIINILVMSVGVATVAGFNYFFLRMMNPSWFKHSKMWDAWFGQPDLDESVILMTISRLDMVPDAKWFSQVVAQVCAHAIPCRFPWLAPDLACCCTISKMAQKTGECFVILHVIYIFISIPDDPIVPRVNNVYSLILGCCWIWVCRLPTRPTSPNIVWWQITMFAS